MSTIQISKKGGPYNKQQKEKRRIQVYKLYFEESKPVVKIAEELKVNRNTVNEDLRFWYSQLACEISNENVVSSALKQIHNMELQKTRLREQLENTSEFSQKITIEKLLFEIESRLAQLIGKIMANGKKLQNCAKIEISENEIKEMIRDLVLENESPDEDADVYSENEIKFKLIRKTKCDASYADAFLQEMSSLGLELCEEDKEEEDFGYSRTFNLAKFATLRGYISIDESSELCKKRQRVKEEIKKLEVEKLAEKNSE